MRTASSRSGFTINELMVAIGISALVTAGTFGAIIASQRMWHRTTGEMEAARKASMGLMKMVYGGHTNGGLRSAADVIVTGTDRIDYTGTAGLPGLFMRHGDRIVNEYGQTVCDGVRDFAIVRDGSVLTIDVTVLLSEGGVASSNAMSTSVFLRNDRFGDDLEGGG